MFVLSSVLNVLEDFQSNSVDPDQTVPLGAVWSWFELFTSIFT